MRSEQLKGCLGPIDKYKHDSGQFLTFQWNAIKDIMRQVYQDCKMYTTSVRAELDRTQHLDATVSSNLAEHPLFSMTPRYRMRLYLKHKLGYGQRDTMVRNRYAGMFQRVEAHMESLEGRISSPRMYKPRSIQLHKELFFLKDVEEWSKGPTLLKNLPPLVTYLLQSTYKVDMHVWKLHEETQYRKVRSGSK